VLRVSSRNARFQQWESLLGNRGKRQRNREFLVQGVRPITLAAEFGWPFRALIYDAERQLSAWARAMLADVPALHVAMSPGLLAELAIAVLATLPAAGFLIHVITAHILVSHCNLSIFSSPRDYAPNARAASEAPKNLERNG